MSKELLDVQEAADPKKREESIVGHHMVFFFEEFQRLYFGSFYATEKRTCFVVFSPRIWISEFFYNFDTADKNGIFLCVVSFFVGLSGTVFDRNDPFGKYKYE